MHPNVHRSIIYNSQDTEATKVSMDRLMDKEDVEYIYNGTSLSHKKEWNFATCHNMDGPGGYFAKWSSQAEKDKYCMLPHICGI